MSATIDTNTEAAANKNGETSGNLDRKLSSQVGRANFWRAGAPKGVANNGGWAIWSHHLAKRRGPCSADRLCNSKGTALVWGINVPRLPIQTFDLVQLVAQANRGKLPHRAAVADIMSQWLTNRSVDIQSMPFALECLAVANLLPRIAATIGEELWWTFLSVLAEIADQSQNWHVDSDALPDQALAHQLLVGELPLTLAYLFPEIRPLYKLRTAAQDALTDGLMEFLNGAGLPKASLLPVSRGLLACWTRSRAMGREWRQDFWSAKAEEQYRLAAGKSVCLSSSTGHVLLCDSDAPAWTPDFLAAVLKSGGRAADRTGALDLFDKKLTKKLEHKSGKHIPEFSESCEWSGLALLRTNLGRGESVVAIDYSQPEMKVDFWLGSEQLLAGTWKTETAVGGQCIEPVGIWEETCWFSDSDVDYVEFSIELAQGLRLERQIALARNDRFLLFADNVMNASGETVRHRLSLPLGTAVSYIPEGETREGLLIGNRPLGRVLPIALPEWRVDPRIGELSATDGQLELVEERLARNLSCPLFFDLDSKRLNKPCTWRQLTVAQSLEIQPHDVAVGYRIQCGKKQWLYYRSQAAAANRTVLGYNLSIEGLIGRFLAPSGEVEELLQIEG